MGHILTILWVKLGTQMAPTSYVFPCKKTRRFQLTFVNILGCLLIVFGVNFRTLGSSNIRIWCRRNADFHKSGFPKSHLKNESPQSMEKIGFGVNVGSLFWVSFNKNATRNQIKKRVGRKLEKSAPQRPRVDLTVHRGMVFETQNPCWGGWGGLTKNSLLIILHASGLKPGEFWGAALKWMSGNDSVFFLL